ncbi:MAG TPA: hypothetical protein VGZ48_12045 [Candidatus Acidoferrales bacterium]|jgi:hypothetical protein|nr:hypothetical protein [Candidatus Acidoferrales bacterium]
MKHFSSIEWIDFVNGVTQPAGSVEMQKHLDSGCKRCLEAVAVWRKVRETGASEAAYQPPAAALRIAKAQFAPRKKVRASAGLSLIFDSFLQPAVMGVRSSGNDVRQLLYRVGAFQLDLCVEATLDRKRVVVTGQLMNAKNPEQAMCRFPILVSDCKGLTLGAETNEFGEFRTEITNTGEIELKLPNPQGKHHVISVHDVLGSWTGSAE